MDNYLIEIEKPWKGNEFASRMRNEFKNELQDVISNMTLHYDDYVVRASKINRWIFIQWYVILNRLISSSAQNGYYIVFLFKSDMSGFYLSLNFGASEFNEKYRKEYGIPIIEAANNFRNILQEKYTFNYQPMDLKALPSGETGSLKEDYEKGDIYNIEYSYDNLPSEEELKDDLQLFLEMYDYLVENRGKEIFTADELLTFSSSPNYVNPAESIDTGGMGDDDVQNINYWVYSPGESAYKWDEFYENGIMGIGWNETGDLKDYSKKDEIKLKLQEVYNDESSHKNDVHALWQFANEIQIGDIIFAKKGKSELIGVGVVKSDYIFSTNFDYYHIRKINWIKRGHWPFEGLPMKTLTNITLYTEWVEEIKEIMDFDGKKRKLSEYSREDFLNEVYIDLKEYNDLVKLLVNKKNLIVQGAPGVGKTFLAKRLAYSIMGVKDSDRVLMVQFHQSYSYEDFVMGYRPSKDGFELRHGSFYKFCKKAEEDSDNDYFFIIDEINRGNLSKIFGELFMLIENDKRGKNNKIQLLYSDESFFIPKNVYIIGLMNTADRSLAMIDYALRRRFAFFDLKPSFDSEGFITYQNDLDNENFDNIVDVMKELNQEIKEDESLGEGFRIGHSYLCNIKQENVDEKLNYIVKYEIIPLLKEYWFDDFKKVEYWSTKLRSVLDDNS